VSAIGLALDVGEQRSELDVRVRERGDGVDSARRHRLKARSHYFDILRGHRRSIPNCGFTLPVLGEEGRWEKSRALGAFAWIRYARCCKSR
jgi:hypothetical protein